MWLSQLILHTLASAAVSPQRGHIEVLETLRRALEKKQFDVFDELDFDKIGASLESVASKVWVWPDTDTGVELLEAVRNPVWPDFSPDYILETKLAFLFLFLQRMKQQHVDLPKATQRLLEAYFNKHLSHVVIAENETNQPLKPEFQNEAADSAPDDDDFALVRDISTQRVTRSRQQPLDIMTSHLQDLLHRIREALSREKK